MIARVAVAVLLLCTVACSSRAVKPSPADPAGAVDDPYVPFAEPLRSDLVGATAAIAGQVKGEHRCAESRLLRIGADSVGTVADHYGHELAGWKPLPVTAPAFSRAFGWEKDGAIFAIVVPRGSQGGWAGYGIVTDTVWDMAARERIGNCLKVRG